MRDIPKPDMAPRSGVPERVYLGDGCYATFDGLGIWLTTENGVEVTNEVYLEPIALAALVQFAAECGLASFSGPSARL